MYVHMYFITHAASAAINQTLTSLNLNLKQIIYVAKYVNQIKLFFFAVVMCAVS